MSVASAAADPPFASAPRLVLPVTALALAGGAGVFFAGSAAAPALAREWSLTASQAAALAWSGQAGFIAGTLASSLLNLADRYPPSRVVAAMLALSALVNGAFTLLGPDQYALAFTLRVLAGAIAGPVYPIGMKLLATWFPRLGWELGVLLGVNTLGFGAAFIARAAGLRWEAAVLGASAVAVLGAALSLLVLREGPRLPARSPFDPHAALRAFREPDYRRSAFAYFGHMWELFAFWALVPYWLAGAGRSASFAAGLAGAVFVAGAVGCVAAGAWSRRVGEARAARLALATSGALCLASPLLFGAPPWLLAPVVLVWGAAVVADSAMFSAISARAAPREYVGTALTTQNLVGFAITVPAIALVPLVAESLGSWRFALLALAPGPLLGLVPLARLVARGVSPSIPTPADRR